MQEKRKVEAICLKFDDRKQYHFTYENFSRLPSLRFLHVDSLKLREHLMENTRAQWKLRWHNWPFKAAQAVHLGKRSGLLPKLRWLSWHNYPRTFDITKFSLVNLAILDLSWSKLTESWDGWGHIKVRCMLGTILLFVIAHFCELRKLTLACLLQVAKNLKVLNLMGCTRLKKTPDLSALVNLERLILEKCEILEEIDKSIGQLRHLVLLNLNFCKKLRRLPEELRDMESLEELLTDGTSIEDMPERQGHTGASSSMEQISRSSHVSSAVLAQCLLRPTKANFRYTLARWVRESRLKMPNL